MVWPWVSLQRTPRPMSFSQYWRAPPASGSNSIPIINPLQLDASEETMADTKKKFLEQEGLINPKPERVSHPLFETLNFFDPLDLPQIRYEMIRAASVENISVSQACKLFGFSREYFYKLERSFMAANLTDHVWSMAELFKFKDNKPYS